MTANNEPPIDASTASLVRRRTAIPVVIAFISVVGFWLFGTPSGVMGKAIAIGYAICHRIATRSFQADGMIMPLCARCTGMYLGVMTGLLIMGARGRIRSSRLPPLPILLVLVGFGVVMGIDGVNSYIQLFPGVVGVYQPHNILRVVTGMYCGIAIIHLVMPIFNGVVWREPDLTRSLDGWADLLGVCAAGAVMIVLVLSERPLLLWILGVLSALGALLLLVIVGTALFLSFARLTRRAYTLRQLTIPLIAGFTIALIEIGAMDILRFALVHNWDGFKFP